MSWTRQDPGPDKTLTQARSRVQAKLWTRHAFALDAVWNDKRFSESRSFIDRGLKRHFYRLSRVLRLKGADRKMSTARPCALYVGQQQKRAANMLSQNENTLAFEKFRCMLFFRFAICRGISWRSKHFSFRHIWPISNIGQENDNIANFWSSTIYISRLRTG